MAVRHRVLVIEDNIDLAHILPLHLNDLGCDVEVARDGQSGLRLAANGSYDLIILDILLPEIDGLEICRRLRAHRNYTPVLMLTSKSSEVDRVIGLEMGADDYLTKPFSIAELQARVKAILRRKDLYRAEPEQGGELLTIGGLRIDVAQRTVVADGRPVALTAKEFDLLLLFARAPGRVFTRAQMLDLVWGYSHDGYEHTVNSHINRLRAKIEADARNPKYIVTVWGVGYKLDPPPGGQP